MTSLLLTNDSSQSYDEPNEEVSSFYGIHTYITFALLVIVTILTVLGNLLVMIAILKTKTLRSTQYIFIFCLASTDLCLGLMVLPFAAYMELTKSWDFGALLCNIWVSLDVMLCSASVLHLLLITIDRKLAIKYAIEYRFVVTKPRIAFCLIIVWLVSIGNSFVPIFLGWNTADGRVQNVVNPTGCTYDMSNKWYCLIVGLVTFIIPLLVMAVMYIDILHMARVQSKKIREQTVFASTSNTHNPKISSAEDSKYSNLLTVPGGGGGNNSAENSPSRVSFTNKQPRGSVALQRIRTNFDNIYRENKATVTVFVIFGLFFICWFPYMVLYTFWPLQGHGMDTVNPVALKIFVWTGYVNSTVNPVLYTMLNTTFRDALKKLFFRRRGNDRSAMLDLDFQIRNGHQKVSMT